MNLIKLSVKNALAKPLSSLLSIILFAFGVAVIISIILTSSVLKEEISKNAKGIDLVVGAKGSPLQIILSSIFHVDFPTGNITLKDANDLSKNRFISSAIPMSLGDSYKGYRIVGTTSDYLDLYNGVVKEGKLFDADMEAVVGAKVAEILQIEIGQKLESSHGLSEGGGAHEETPFEVVGVLEPSGNVIDQLIFVSVPSVWKVHESHEEDDHGHQHSDTSFLLPKMNFNVTEAQLEHESITSMLVQYRSPMAAVQLPRIVNKTSNLQAASPAYETARLFSIIGVGVEVVNILGLVIVIISASSIFIALLNSLKERKYELAIMRSLGASRIKIFLLILLEGFFLTICGLFAGFLLAHGGFVLLINALPELSISKTFFDQQEIVIIASGVIIGLVASLVPSIMAYRSDISETLAKA